MKLVNMKNPQPDSAAARSELAGCDKEPEYPYGLEVRLDDVGIRKLGFGEMPPVGTPLVLTARVEVVETMQRDSKDGGDNKGLTLQITDMALDGPPRDDRAMAARFWPQG